MRRSTTRLALAFLVAGCASGAPGERREAASGKISASDDPTAIARYSVPEGCVAQPDRMIRDGGMIGVESRCLRYDEARIILDLSFTRSTFPPSWGQGLDTSLAKSIRDDPAITLSNFLISLSVSTNQQRIDLIRKDDGKVEDVDFATPETDNIAGADACVRSKLLTTVPATEGVMSAMFEIRCAAFDKNRDVVRYAQLSVMYTIPRNTPLPSSLETEATAVLSSLRFATPR